MNRFQRSFCPNLERIQTTIALNKIDGKLNLGTIWCRAKYMYLIDFRSKKLKEIDQEWHGQDYHQLCSDNLSQRAAKVLRRLEYNAFSLRRDAMLGKALIAVGFVAVILAVIYWSNRSLTLEPQSNIAERNEIPVVAATASRSNVDEDGGAEARDDELLKVEPTKTRMTSRDEQVATFINLNGYLCGRLIDAYKNSDGSITARCTEFRDGRGHATYNLNLDTATVEKLR